MYHYFGDLFDVLTEDQRDLVVAKLRSAIAHSLVIENDLHEFVDALDSDMPFQERMGAGMIYGTLEFDMADVIKKGMLHATEAASAQRNMRDELCNTVACL